jgi:hypothetical protein
MSVAVIINSTVKNDTTATAAWTNLGVLPTGITGLVWPPGATTSGGAWFFELEVGEVTDGNALICVYSTQISKTTTMEYYYGGWQNASAIVRFIGSPISYIGGYIPVSALIGGTEIVVGTPIDPQSTFLIAVAQNMRLLPFAERHPMRLFLPW